MNHKDWEAHLSICRKVETGGNNSDHGEDPAILAEQQGFIDRFRQYLPPPARILAPGAVSEALLLARAGYEIHTILLGPDNVKWVNDRKAQLPNPALLHAYELDGHKLLGPFSENYFDGYFSIQVHEHWLSPIVHITEARFVLRDGAKVFVDACGTTNEACKMAWHVNLVPAKTVMEQWEYGGFSVLWEGPHGDNRPQFIFNKLPWGQGRNDGYLSWVRRLRRGEKISYRYTCAEPECKK